MKKNRTIHGLGPCVLKLIKVMKLTVFLMLISLMGVFASETYSQITKLSLKAERISLEEFLVKIEDQSEFRFFYTGKIDVEQEIFCEFKNKNINEILDEIKDEASFQYEVMGRQIILYPNDAENSIKSIQQQKSVSGKVTDSSGSSLIGATIVVKGSAQGTVTNANGEYSLSNVPEDATLVFSFVGMKTHEIPVAGKANINVILAEETVGLEEVVAVGYGVQKKINLSGSISAISSKTLENKTIETQTSQLLAGEMGGVTITEEWGKPGKDQSTIRIRGLGTFSDAGNSPLVLVDGVPMSIDNIDPNNVANVTVLKDASSAAIYGSRAANGVIIIETKKGKEGQIQVQYESYIGKQETAELPEYLNSWDYAQARNTALINMKQSPMYTQDQIEKFKSGAFPDDYPNNQRIKDLFNSGNGIQAKHNLTLSGGTNKNRYLFSIGYLRKNGLLDKNYNDRYDLLVNINSDLTDNLKFNSSIKGYKNLVMEPAGFDEGITVNMDRIIASAHSINAAVPGKRSDGSYGVYMGHPVTEALMDSKGFNEEKGIFLSSNASLEWDIRNNLKLTGKVGYNLDFNTNKLFGAQIEAGRGYFFGPTKINVNWNKNEYLIADATLDYEERFGKHYFHVLTGLSREESNYYFLSGYRDNFPTNDLPELCLASPENDTNDGGTTTWKLSSYFGRINYSFNDRYLLEGNLRYDGSSRFSEGNKFGFFPSFSAAWIVSEEEFFKVPWIDKLKIRASYGTLGNQQIGIYPYQKVLRTGYNFYPGESVSPGVRLAVLPNQDITWESTRIIDGGLDISFFKGKLNLVVDYYYKKTSDILYNLTASKILGMGIGLQNAGEVENKGWDFELNYKDQIGNIEFEIHPVFSIVDNKVLNLSNVEKDIARGLFVGHSLESFYGYETEGLFINQQEIANYAKQNYKAEPGYIKYKDISGPDGVPDGIISSAYDRKILGSSLPKYNFGISFSANYKNFDFYLQAQGVGGLVKRIHGAMLALYNEGNIEEWQWRESWTEENPDPNAKYPKFVSSYHLPIFSDANDYWLRDASFLRIKNVQIGYNLPFDLLKSTFIDHCRIFIAGRNIYTFKGTEKGWDPEMYLPKAGNYFTFFYPPTRIWSLGISLNF